MCFFDRDRGTSFRYPDSLPGQKHAELGLDIAGKASPGNQKGNVARCAGKLLLGEVPSRAPKRVNQVLLSPAPEKRPSQVDSARTTCESGYSLAFTSSN